MPGNRPIHGGSGLCRLRTRRYGAGCGRALAGIIGEALSRAAGLEPALVDRIPELRQIVGLRNRVIHGYDAVDDEIVWDIVQNKLPRLQVRVAGLLGKDASQ